MYHQVFIRGLQEWDATVPHRQGFTRVRDMGDGRAEVFEDGEDPNAEDGHSDRGWQMVDDYHEGSSSGSIPRHHNYREFHTC